MNRTIDSLLSDFDALVVVMHIGQFLACRKSVSLAMCIH